MNPYLKDLHNFADLLQACNIVDEEAVYDPDGYDGEVTMQRIAEAHRRMVESEPARDNEILRLEAELAKTSTLQQRLTIAEGTITDLRNKVASLMNDARAKRQVDAGHAMYRGGLVDQIRTLRGMLDAQEARHNAAIELLAEQRKELIATLGEIANSGYSAMVHRSMASAAIAKITT